jgi:hypothetical protein
LEKDTGNYAVQRNGLTMGKQIMKKRNEFGWTQKDLGFVCDFVVDSNINILLIS